MKKAILILVLTLSFVGIIFAQGEIITPEAYASYYGEKFHGRLTANGEIFDMNAYTAAHRTLPFGTIVEVTNLENGKKVIVRINDRGPFVGNREIDVSKAAAAALDMLSRGVTKVSIKKIDTSNNTALGVPKQAVSTQAQKLASQKAKAQDTYQAINEKNQRAVPTTQPYMTQQEYIDQAKTNANQVYQQQSAQQYTQQQPAQTVPQYVQQQAATERVAQYTQQQPATERAPQYTQQQPAQTMPQYKQQTAPQYTQRQPAKTAPQYVQTQAQPSPVYTNEVPRQLVYIPTTAEQTPGPLWRIQLGSFTREENAMRLVIELRKINFEPAYEKTETHIRVVLYGIRPIDLEKVKTVLKTNGFNDYILRQESW